MKIHIPKYNPNSEFERKITNQHNWVIMSDGGPEQCTKCGCWDPTPVGMPEYSMAPITCNAIPTCQKCGIQYHLENI